MHIRKPLIGVVATVAAVTMAVAPAAAAVGPAATGYVATIDASGERYRIQLVDQNDIDQAFASLNGQSSKFPNGGIVDGTDVNAGYSWHIDSSSVEFVDVSMELCDGRPSDVTGADWGGGRFCPWSGKVVAMQEN